MEEAAARAVERFEYRHYWPIGSTLPNALCVCDIDRDGESEFLLASSEGMLVAFKYGVPTPVYRCGDMDFATVAVVMFSEPLDCAVVACLEGTCTLVPRQRLCNDVYSSDSSVVNTGSTSSSASSVGMVVVPVAVNCTCGTTYDHFILLGSLDRTLYIYSRAGEGRAAFASSDMRGSVGKPSVAAGAVSLVGRVFLGSQVTAVVALPSPSPGAVDDSHSAFLLVTSTTDKVALWIVESTEPPSLSGSAPELVATSIWETSIHDATARRLLTSSALAAIAIPPSPRPQAADASLMTTTTYVAVVTEDGTVMAWCAAWREVDDGNEEEGDPHSPRKRLAASVRLVLSFQTTALVPRVFLLPPDSSEPTATSLTPLSRDAGSSGFPAGVIADDDGASPPRQPALVCVTQDGCVVTLDVPSQLPAGKEEWSFSAPEAREAVPVPMRTPLARRHRIHAPVCSFAAWRGSTGGHTAAAFGVASVTLSSLTVYSVPQVVDDHGHLTVGESPGEIAVAGHRLVVYDCFRAAAHRRAGLDNSGSLPGWCWTVDDEAALRRSVDELLTIADDDAYGKLTRIVVMVGDSRSEPLLRWSDDVMRTHLRRHIKRYHLDIAPRATSKPTAFPHRHRSSDVTAAGSDSFTSSGGVSDSTTLTDDEREEEDEEEESEQEDDEGNAIRGGGSDTAPGGSSGADADRFQDEEERLDDVAAVLAQLGGVARDGLVET